MSRLPRPCIGAISPTGLRETCGRPTTATRCSRHEAMYQAVRRPSPSKRGYDAEYQRERKELLDTNPECALKFRGCTVIATTADHVVPLAVGGDIRGELVPACAHCNSTKGAR